MADQVVKQDPKIAVDPSETWKRFQYLVRQVVSSTKQSTRRIEPSSPPRRSTQGQKGKG